MPLDAGRVCAESPIEEKDSCMHSSPPNGELLFLKKRKLWSKNQYIIHSDSSVWRYVVLRRSLHSSLCIVQSFNWDVKTILCRHETHPELEEQFYENIISIKFLVLISHFHPLFLVPGNTFKTSSVVQQFWQLLRVVFYVQEPWHRKKYKNNLWAS